MVENKWSDLKKLKGTQYLKFAYRQLKWERPDKIQPVVQEFIDKLVGKPYDDKPKAAKQFSMHAQFP